MQLLPWCLPPRSEQERCLGIDLPWTYNSITNFLAQIIPSKPDQHQNQNTQAETHYVLTQEKLYIYI